MCFYIVEMHQYHRLKLQFGHLQKIPGEPQCLQEQYQVTLIKLRNYVYTKLFSDEQLCWLNQEIFMLEGNQLQEKMRASTAYMQWYMPLPFRYASYEQFISYPRQHEYALNMESGSQQFNQIFQQQPHYSQTPIPQPFQQQSPNPDYSQQ